MVAAHDCIAAHGQIAAEVAARTCDFGIVSKAIRPQVIISYTTITKDVVGGPFKSILITGSTIQALPVLSHSLNYGTSAKRSRRLTGPIRSEWAL